MNPCDGVYVQVTNPFGVEALVCVNTPQYWKVSGRLSAVPVILYTMRSRLGVLLSVNKVPVCKMRNSRNGPEVPEQSVKRTSSKL